MFMKWGHRASETTGVPESPRAEHLGTADDVNGKCDTEDRADDKGPIMPDGVMEEPAGKNPSVPAIEIRNLTKRYGCFFAVDKLNLSVGKGEFMGLLGPNGAGKSTTLKAVTGLLSPTDGEILINGVNSMKHKAAMTHVGCVIETPQCYPEFSPTDMLTYVGRIHGIPKDEIRIRAKDVLEELRMWSWRNMPVGGFSKGMKQRVALAAALLPNPDIIVLDEPTSGLDPRGMIEIRQILNGLKKRGLTLMISTHILKEVSEMCTHVTMINHGKMVISGDVEGILRDLSSRDKNGVKIELKTLRPTNGEFISDLGAIGGVDNIEEMSDRHLKMTFSGTDEEQVAISDLVYGANLGLICMNVEGADLEALYMSLTDDGKVSVR